VNVISTLLLCSGRAVFVALAPQQKQHWCALTNSAYFLCSSLLAILNGYLRLFTCMLHPETTARTWRILWSPEDWSPQGLAGFALISTDFRASGADSLRAPVCVGCYMLPAWWNHGSLLCFQQERSSSAICGVLWEVTWVLWLLQV